MTTGGFPNYRGHFDVATAGVGIRIQQNNVVTYTNGIEFGPRKGPESAVASTAPALDTAALETLGNKAMTPQLM